MSDPMTRRGLLRRSAHCLALAAVPAMAPKRASAAAQQEEPAKPIVIGALFPATGPLAVAGDESWRGVQLAFDATRNVKGPAAIRVIRAEASDAEGAAKAISTLRSQGAAAILGTTSSTLSFAATETAELAGIPYIELDAPADGITKRKFRTLLRTGPTSADATAVAYDTIVKLLAPAWEVEPAKLRIGVVFDIGASNGAFAASILSALAGAHIPVLLPIAYAQDRTDLDEPVRRMQRAALDLVIHASEPDGTILLNQAMALNKWRPRMLIGTGPGYALTTVADIIGRDFDRTMVVAPPNFAPAGTKSASAAIAEAYRVRFATAPRGPASLTAYVGAALAIEAIRARDPIARLVGQTLPLGALANGFGLQFDSSGQNRRSFVTLQQWRNGSLVPIEPGRPGAMSPILE